MRESVLEGTDNGNKSDCCTERVGVIFWGDVDNGCCKV